MPVVIPSGIGLMHRVVGSERGLSGRISIPIVDLRWWWGWINMPNLFVEQLIEERRMASVLRILVLNAASRSWSK